MSRRNLLLIITDQERHPMYWPEGFAEQKLKSRERLLRHGVSFENATCNTAMCSPSRATLFTGMMPAQHKVVDTLTTDGPVSATESWLNPGMPNLGTVLREAGYDVQYRGKWHLSKSSSGGVDITPEDVRAYGFDGWVPPDAGFDAGPENFGAGRPDNDAHYIAQALEYLDSRAAGDDGRPFCLVLSLVNPHDLQGYPDHWREDFDESQLEGPVALPPTVGEDLAATLKPRAQAFLAPILNAAVGKLDTEEDQLRYVNFYANLTVQIDEQIAPVIDRFYGEDGEPTELGRETVIVRISDHGELGLSHGALRQKAFNVYEETLRVPFIVSNPDLAPGGRVCPHPASLVDLVPTVAGLLEVPLPDGLQGRDLSPMVSDADHPPVQDEVMFTFDDMHAGTGRVKELIPAAGRIRALRERRYKFARYFDANGSYPTEHEMYDLDEDPLELENLAHPDHPRYAEPQVSRERERLSAKLALLEERLAGSALRSA